MRRSDAATPNVCANRPISNALWHDSIVTTPTSKAIRKFWRTIETIHTVVYFSPESRSAYKSIGLRGYWSGYFASRAAPLGTPSAEVVTSMFYGFAPKMVAKAIPDAWALADRDEILATRERIAVNTLESVLGADDVSEVADRLMAATEPLSYAGRTLAAAHRALPVPEAPLARLWHAASILREYRGDGHNAVLTAAHVGPVEANILQAAIGKAFDDQQAARGWSDADWAAGHDQLAGRGWIDASGALTELGADEREEIETLTDVASSSAIIDLVDTPIAESLLNWARTITKSDAISLPNFTGVPKT